MKKSICFIIAVLLITLLAAPLFAASNPQTTTPLAPKPDPKVPKNFEVYDQRVKEYNAKGQLVKETILYNNTVAIGETRTFEYDSTGKLVKECLYLDGQLDDFFTYEYDKDGRLSKETEYGAKGKLKNFKTYEYLDKGLTVVKKNIKADGTYYRYTVKRYDAAGNHLETSEYRIK
ncbi:MAG: hypothetical protein IJQ27_02955 [Spirochaetia bacterium]|nr:hypothetical protein [Spirochaetia bacterium]